MNPKYVTLESMTGLGNPSVSHRVPDDIERYRFVGYDSSGTRTDRKGVMVFREIGSKLFELSPFSREIKVGRSGFDQEIERLEGLVQSAQNQIYFTSGSHERDMQNKRKLIALKDIQKRTDEENPTVYRESRGRLVNNPVINGVEYTVNMAWTQTQIGEGSLPYFLKGDELVVSDGSRQILAHRYFKDPRVVVHGTFEGDVRRPTNFSTEIDEQTKANLTILFKQLYREIEEVAFPNEKRPVK